ncbi:MAG TPA: UDP-N-acetylmuramate dehydrogenase [Candidatus Nitrosotenuis sp.]|nr:UDP-N-acetylmuramate dehydrogenase [Candidatus Nitrosotenuis sp.]
MHITQQRLSDLTTMRLGGATQTIDLTARESLPGIIEYARAHNMPFFAMGDGSNVIATDNGYPGLLILNQIPGFDILEENEEYTVVRVGAGENWDSVVARTVEMELSGIEAMSAIPGSAGATPVQNVGAYGQEIADILMELDAYDTDINAWVTLQNEECHFSYRDSIFKNPQSRHHIITSITLRLKKGSLQPPFYQSLEQYFSLHSITDYSPHSVRKAVVAIRAEKLPDPTKIANTGSFFKNPLVNAQKAKELAQQYPSMPMFPMKDGSVKLAAGWLIETAGLKGIKEYGFETYEHNALVVINESAHSYAALEQFRRLIIDKVNDAFGVTLEQEPELLSDS